MHPYYYVNSKGSGQLYNHQISVPAIYLQPQIPKRKEVNGPKGSTGQVYSTDRMIPVEIESYDDKEPPFNWVSPAGQMDVAAQESFSGWTKPTDNYGYTSNGHFEKSTLPDKHDDWESQEKPANWHQFPESPGLAPQGQFTPWGTQPLHYTGMSAQGHYQGLSPSASPAGINSQNQPFPLTHPMNHAGFNAQGQPVGWAPSTGNKGFNSQNQPFPWTQPGNHVGMFAHGKPAVNPFGFSANGQQANLGNFGNPAGLEGQVNPMGWGGLGSQMGWGNNSANGQPGVLGSLLKVGKGTMNGIGIISSLIGMGKFLF